jgi:phage baseplate assembly protein V
MTQLEEIIGELIAKVDHLTNEVSDLRMENQDLQRRIVNMIRPARVTKTKRGESKVVVAYDTDEEGADVETHDVNWTSLSAGKIKISNPPSEGQQGWLISTSGDIDETSVFMPANWSDEFKDPHNADGELMTTIEDEHKDLSTKKLRKIEVECFHVVCKEFIVEASTGIQLKSPTINVEGDITHVGNMNSTGVHVDSIGPHSA